MITFGPYHEKDSIVKQFDYKDCQVTIYRLGWRSGYGVSIRSSSGVSDTQAFLFRWQAKCYAKNKIDQRS